MEKEIFNLLISLISIFNKELTLNDIEYTDNLEDFLKYNSTTIFDTFNYIDYYQNILVKLNNEDIAEVETINNNTLLSPAVIELILLSEKKKKEEMNYILYNQRKLIYKYLKIANNMIKELIGHDNGLEENIYEFKNNLKYEYKLKNKRIKVKKLVKY